MNKPTIEEYNQAKSNIDYAQRALFRCRERRNQLIDELVTERSNEKSYMEYLEKQKEVVMIYETYEKIEKGDVLC